MNERDKMLFLKGLEVGLKLAEEYKEKDAVTGFASSDPKVKRNRRKSGKRGPNKWLKKYSESGKFYYVPNPEYVEKNGLAKLGQHKNNVIERLDEMKDEPEETISEAEIVR